MKLRNLKKSVSESSSQTTRTQNHTKTMDNFRETIMQHIKNKHSLTPTQISAFQDRLSHILSQFHTPHHLPYAAMIQRAIRELKQRGGCTETSISEFIKREYDDLPWAHCSLLKHHLGILSEHGDITMTRGFRYSICGADSSLGSMKGGKKHRRKKCKWSFERKQAKRHKLAIVVRSQKENEIEVIKDPSQVNDQNWQVAGNAVIETEKCQSDTDGVQTPKKNGTIGTSLLQFTDGGEDDICSGSKAMDIEHPPLLVSTDGRGNRAGLEQEKQQENCQLKLHDPCDLHAMELHAWIPNEDVIHEVSSPKRPPGFEFRGVEVSDSQECLIMNDHPLQTSKLPATTVSPLSAATVSPRPTEKKELGNVVPTPVAEKLEKNYLTHPLQPIHKKEKKKGKYVERRQFDKMIEQQEVLLALPHLQEGSPLLRDGLMQNERSCRQLRRWSGDLPDISHTAEVPSSAENFGKRPRVEITPEAEKSQVLKKLPSEITIITRTRAGASSFQRQGGAQPQPGSVSLCPTEVQQDEGKYSQGVCHSTQLLALLQQDKDRHKPIIQYQRRCRIPKSNTNTIVHDKLRPRDIQKQQAEELPKLLCYHIQQEKTQKQL